MSLLNKHLLLPVIAFSVAAASMVTWIVGAGFAELSATTRLALAAVNLALAGGVAGWFAVAWQRERKVLTRALHSLIELNAGPCVSKESEFVVPVPLRKSPWGAMLRRLGEALQSSAQRFEELEHVRAAQEIRLRRGAEHQERISRILASLPEPVLAVDQFDDLVIANRSAEKLFGFSSEACQERQALKRLVRCGPLVELISETRRRRVATSRTEEFEIEHPDGTSRWYSVTVSNLANDSREDDSDEASRGAVAVLRDISAQKIAQKRHAEFVSAVSHEMKTPLAGIKAYVELLADGDAEDEETREEFLKVINSQADRLQRLIDNMLNLARIEAGVVKVDRQHRSLNELLDEALGVVQPSAERKRIELTSDLSPMYLGVLADRDMLLQAAINLLSNAIKYTPEGGRVTLRSRMRDGEVQFEVEDNGVGLSEDDCRKVFERFYRVKKDKDMAPGTGLGLPLVKHIVEDVHNGTVTATSTLGVGSTFLVTLPNAGQLSGAAEAATWGKTHEQAHSAV